MAIVDRSSKFIAHIPYLDELLLHLEMYNPVIKDRVVKLVSSDRPS